jgi:hypothetical protein
VYYEANPGYGYTLHIGHGTGKMDPMYPETPKAKREYYGLNLSIDKRLANNWLGGFSYTWSRLSGNSSGLSASDEFGRTSPYVERQFDSWIMTVDKNLNYVDGVLNTDRTHFFKCYGAYSFPFHLTIGGVVNAMSGTPFTEYWSAISAYFFPFGRGTNRVGESGSQMEHKRTPFYWFANAYAEYNLNIGKYRININVNVDNIFDNAISARLYQYRTYYDLGISEATALSKNWDLANAPNYRADPRFGKKMDFQGPISARFGIKFIF